MHLLLVFLFTVGLFEKCVFADDDTELKRGVYPFMAFVYYPDKTILDRTGAKLVRGAVLIRPDWLVSSSLEDSETSLAFPKETLVARLGAVRIDARFTINEDEDEQEREIIEIARPYNYSASEWWYADISILKTLMPFNITSSASLGAINAITQNDDRSCFILIYSALSGNKSEDKILIQLFVDLLPSTPENCGSNFVKSSMLCATDNDLKREYFCEGNSGSPLICNNDVVGIQTYINDCKPPHLYQHLNSWNNLIICAIEDKCQEEQCASICNVINKDSADATQRVILAEAKVYQDETLNKSHNEMTAPTTVNRRLLDDDSNTVFDKVSNNEASTETTISTSSKVVYIAKEIEISSDTVTPTVTGNTEEDHDTSTSSVSKPSISYPTDSESTHYIYKTEELVSKVEELKNLIEENVASNNTQVEETQQNYVRSAAVKHHPCCIISANLMLFYLQFSLIVNSF